MPPRDDQPVVQQALGFVGGKVIGQLPNRFLAENRAKGAEERCSGSPWDMVKDPAVGLCFKMTDDLHAVIKIRPGECSSGLWGPLAWILESRCMSSVALIHSMRSLETAMASVRESGDSPAVTGLVASGNFQVIAHSPSFG